MADFDAAIRANPDSLKVRVGRIAAASCLGMDAVVDDDVIRLRKADVPPKQVALICGDLLADGGVLVLLAGELSVRSIRSSPAMESVSCSALSKNHLNAARRMAQLAVEMNRAAFPERGDQLKSLGQLFARVIQACCVQGKAVQDPRLTLPERDQTKIAPVDPMIGLGFMPDPAEYKRVSAVMERSRFVNFALAIVCDMWQGTTLTDTWGIVGGLSMIGKGLDEDVQHLFDALMSHDSTFADKPMTPEKSVAIRGLLVQSALFAAARANRRAKAAYGDADSLVPPTTAPYDRRSWRIIMSEAAAARTVALEDETNSMILFSAAKERASLLLPNDKATAELVSKMAALFESRPR